MKCRQMDCDEDAVLTVYWPGSTSYACHEHSIKALEVAKQMSFSLSLGPLPTPVSDLLIINGLVAHFSKGEGLEL